jgi:hypothetical protein
MELATRLLSAVSDALAHYIDAPLGFSIFFPVAHMPPEQIIPTTW